MGPEKCPKTFTTSPTKCNLELKKKKCYVGKQRIHKKSTITNNLFTIF
jgi:hypothetical protein